MITLEQTFEKIKLDGPAVIDKLKRGEPLTANDRLILKAYNSLFAKKAGNAGKRKIIKSGNG